ncbi:hypothetical protein BJAS_P0743 [Bathymodiolus japonicus methanotrophic gill symbiont]|uniref:hypothetical protein n=1 Tax=Bathymodiolus japonicus methanotrophic gill symbiont TaxID=113269 RepID=UPI001B466ACC|nr:hypothetical protein [Bathymodiolus japonicus methanotrophic gill symbiont]GFO71341.1 hypothetical protein BJAS_P0743 [Bathymodiolus japonicus methanotrophic gill symbiont]
MRPAGKRGCLNGLLLLLMLLIGISRISWSAPVTFNTALPVAKNEFIFRQQFVVNQSGHDASESGRDRIAWSAISVVCLSVAMIPVVLSGVYLRTLRIYLLIMLCAVKTRKNHYFAIKAI